MVQLRNIIIALVLLAGTAGIVLAQKNTAPAPSGDAPATTDATLEQVAEHATRESCWTVINGGIYDLTSWIPQHPGGEEAILQLCGTDGSALFNGQHGGAARQEAILAGFRIDGGAAQTGTPSASGVEEDDRGRSRGRGGDDNE